MHHIRIWWPSEQTHFYENRQYSSPLLRKSILQYTKAETYTHIARWGCELAVGKNASSLPLCSLSGFWRRELMLKSLMTHLLSSRLPHLLYICDPPSLSLLFSPPLCPLFVSCHSPLTFSPSLISPFPSLYAICLTVAQHSMSWLCLNIDRKVNDKTTVLRCKHTQNYTHKEATTWLVNTACSVAWKQCYAMVDAKKHSHPHTDKHTHTHT